MTRERKLAIQMWEEIKEQIPEWPVDKIAVFLRGSKIKFQCENGVEWSIGCWFCQYTREDCSRCPLKSCDYKDPTTAWARIVDECSSLETRLEACDEIIAALKGESK